MAPPDPSLTRLLCARLCHDLGGAIGTVVGMLDLLEDTDEEALAVARDAATDMRRRLKLYTAAWGQGAEDMRSDEVAELLQGAPAAPRVRFDIEPFLPASLPATIVPLALNAALLASEALPRGGTVHVSGGADAGLAIWPEGVNAAWAKDLPIALAGTDAAAAALDNPRQALLPWLLALLAHAGWECSLGMGAGPGAAPLLLMPVRR